MPDIASLLLDLKDNHNIVVRSTIEGKSLSTYKIGGALKNVIECHTLLQLVKTVEMCNSHQCPFRVVGGGSNILFPDEGSDEIIILLRGEFSSFASVEGPHPTFAVGASVSLMSFSRHLSRLGVSGLEFAGGIPAHLGGAVIMNAGAHGQELFSLIKSIEGVSVTDGKVVILDVLECQAVYRDAGLPLELIVTKVVLQGRQSNQSECELSRSTYLKERKARQPLTLPSAGSVFKNPSSTMSAGSLIEQCQLKGRSHGGAEISTLHANWIVNVSGNASSKDVLALIDLCEEHVKTKFQIDLTREVKVWKPPSL